MDSLIHTTLSITISSSFSYPTGDLALSLLQKTIITLALLTSPYPLLYINSLGFVTHASLELHKENPKTKNIASKMLDLPVPFSPVNALNWLSKSFNTVF